MSTEKQEAKATEYLTSGRVCVVEVSTEKGRGEFLIAGSMSDPYTVLFRSGEWICDCPARVPVCAHVLACQKIVKFEAVEDIWSGSGNNIEDLFGV